MRALSRCREVDAEDACKGLGPFVAACCLKGCLLSSKEMLWRLGQRIYWVRGSTGSGDLLGQGIYWVGGFTGSGHLLGQGIYLVDAVVADQHVQPIALPHSLVDEPRRITRHAQIRLQADVRPGLDPRQ